MTVNEKKIYVETCTLEHCLVNFQPDEMSPKMRERLHEVFPTTNVSQTYVTLAFGYDNNNTDNKTDNLFNIGTRTFLDTSFIKSFPE